MANDSGANKEIMAEEARRLRLFWERYQANLRAKGIEMSQSEFADTKLGFGQANFSHLLSGRQPISTELLFKFAALLEFDPREIRPGVQMHIDNMLKSIGSDEESLITAYFARLSPDNKKQLLEFARFLTGKKGA